MKKSPLLLAVAALFLVAGCATTSSPTPASRPESGIIGKIPPGSSFAKVKMDMSMKQVYALIGEPTDQHTYPTGKSFIPFYFGNDEVRVEARYKGQGRVVFSTGAFYPMQVLRVEYDPNETGYAH